MNLLLDLWTLVAVVAGGLFFLAGTVGLLRFPDSLTRLHALTKADNLGLGLVMLGLLPQAGGILASRAVAFLHGRGYVVPEDVKEIAKDVLRHRVLLTYEAEAENVTSDTVVDRILERVEVP